MLTNDTFLINTFYLIDPLLFTHLSGHKSSIVAADWANLIQHLFKCIFFLYIKTMTLNTKYRFVSYCRELIMLLLINNQEMVSKTVKLFHCSHNTPCIKW